MLGIVLAVAGGCGDHTGEKTSEPVAASTETPVSDKSCYSYFSANDTITLILKGPDTALHGSLVYMLNGKDRNIGTLVGKMSGDTLLADYTYQSEGQSSMREVAFLRKEGQMLQGFGPVQVKDNHQYFSDRGKLQFSSNMALTNQHCH